MRKELFILVLLVSMHGKAFAFPAMSSDSWYTANDIKSATQTVYTSQTAIAYDPSNDRLFMWNGHPPGGGFPQPDDTMVFSVTDGVWSDVRPINSVNPPAS